MKIKAILMMLVCLGFAAQAQHLSGRFSSSVYSFERFNSLQESQSNLRTFQSLYLNFGGQNISVKTRLNLEANLSNSLDNDPRLRFYNLYLEARKVFDVLTVKFGRQPLFNSVAGGLFDGLNLKAKYGIFEVSGYAGGNVPAYQKLALTENFSDNYVLGGKLTAYPVEKVRLAVSYIDKNYKPQEYTAVRLDAQNNPINVLIQQNSNQFEYVSAEASYYDSKTITVNTKYDYDLNFMKMSKFQVSGRYAQVENLGVSFFYNYRAPQIRYNSIFSVFDYGNTQEIEGGLDYKFSGWLTAVGKFANVKYKDDNSQRMTLGLNTSYGNVSYRKNSGYAGELDAFSIYAAKSFDNGTFTPSVGISFTNFKLSSETEKQSITAVLAGLNYRPMRNLSFDLQGQMFSNPIYKNDFRVFFKLNHWFNTNFD